MKLAYLFLLALFALIGAVDPTTIQPDSAGLPPQWGHWLGTDDLGRDLLSRVAIGARISLLIGLATAGVSVIIGTVYGTLSALWGGSRDVAMMRFLDLLYGLPTLMVVILFSVFLGRSLFGLVLALSILSWPDTARLIRGQVQTLMREEFIEAFHSLGGGRLRLCFRHLLPNVSSFLILSLTMTVPRAVLTESTLSFIGLGVEPPLSSWGTLAAEGWQLVRVYPHLLLVPAGFIVITMVVLNLLGDDLKQRFSPRA